MFVSIRALESGEPTVHVTPRDSKAKGIFCNLHKILSYCKTVSTASYTISPSKASLGSLFFPVDSIFSAVMSTSVLFTGFSHCDCTLTKQ